MRLLLATTNANKVREIRPILAHLPIEVLSLTDVPPVPEPEESAATFWENARLKALAYAASTGLMVVAEDSGLVIPAIGGEPGVQSARFLGPNVPYATRFDEIYRRLAATGASDRGASFVTALCAARGDAILFEVETAIDGVIAPRPAGEHGFGYDPIFFYAPLGKTTGEMTIEEKCLVSHRARAFRDFAVWIAADGRIAEFDHQDREAHEDSRSNTK
jgi:XTP/dITP diphosphohydrolase